MVDLYITSVVYFWQLKWPIFENMLVKQTKGVCGNNVKKCLVYREGTER